MAKPDKAKKKSLAPRLFKKPALLKKRAPPKRSSLALDLDPAVQLKKAAAKRSRKVTDALAKVSRGSHGSEVLDRLWAIIDERKQADPELSHSARLLGKGRAQVAQKFGEEAIECVIEGVAGNRTAMIAESADVLYHLLVMWVLEGIQPEEIWNELRSREYVSLSATGPHGAIKRLFGSVQVGTTKIP